MRALRNAIFTAMIFLPLSVDLVAPASAATGAASSAALVARPAVTYAPFPSCGDHFTFRPSGPLSQRLECALPVQSEIIVLSAENHLVFTPMLPEVVGRTISPLHVVVAGRQLTRRTKWLEARVSRIDREKNEAHYLRRDGTTASMNYTHLVLACGAAANLAEIPGLAARDYALKTVMDAI